MLSFLLLASTSDRPLPRDAAGRCSRLPTGDLVALPTAATTWRSRDGRVLLAAWGDDARGWHVADHGITLAAGRPWPLTGSFDAPSGIAFELAQRFASGADSGVLQTLGGSATVVHLDPDGRGLVGTPPTGGGAVHVASGEDLVAISDRAAVAARGAGGGARRTDLPDLVRGVLPDGSTGHVGVRRLGPTDHVVLRGDRVEVVDGPRPTRAAGDDLQRAAAAAADQVAHLVETVVRQPGDRWVELGGDPGSLVVAAAVAATGTAPRLRLRPVRPADEESARHLAARLGVRPESARPVATGGEALDGRVRRAVRRVEGTIAPDPFHGGLLGDARTDGGTILAAVPGGALAPDRGATGRRFLTSQAWTTVDAGDRAWAAGRGRAVGDGARELLAELDRRHHARQVAAASLAGTATLVDPTALPAVVDLALLAAERGEDPVALLVSALHPALGDARVAGGEEPATVVADWSALAPVLEAHVLGHGRTRLAGLLDLDEVAMVVRAGRPPDPDTLRALTGALALAVWVGDRDVHAPATPASSTGATDLETPDVVPTLVTGVTSRSLLDLAQLPVPLDAREDDALLGVTVDRDVRDLVHRILLAVGATPGRLPGDLDQRLSGPATAHLAGPAKSLLARRGGTIADPRLALTLPFWRAHVATPRVVLVAERPPDLTARTSAPLPLRDLLGWWVDAMTAAAASGTDVRVVDPGDLLPLDEAEATGWDGLAADGQDAPDLVRVVRTVDSIVREVELEAARPLLRTIQRARAVDGDVEPAPTPASAPLHVVDELWARAVEADARLAEQQQRADDLQGRLDEAEAALADLRGRRGLRAAWQVLTGRDE